MAGSSDIFAQVRSAIDLVEIIGEHVALKRAGREFKGLCPFHEDHRPSMAVVPHKQIFYCFVCGSGGDVFKFMEMYHKMTKGEALRELAKRAGIKLPELPGRSRAEGKDKDGLSPRERIAASNEWACGFFEKMLRGPSGKAGLEYLRGRGLTDETITRFRLGFSPDSWTGLVNEAFRTQSSALSPQHLSEAGLIKQRSDTSPYDAFRNRVMFPIIDATGGGGGGGAAGKGRVIAFGGRVLEEKRDEAGNVVEAKYLNSPDTKLFNKSESLYGMNLARQQIVRTRTAIVVEGYMDVIACHQAGVTNVIATLGTALTPEHARILKNYAQTIILVFDSDDAGRRAADRAMEVFVKSPLDVKIAAVPDGKDPCDFCMKHGGAAFEKIVEKATDAMTYKWRDLQTRFHGTDSLTARQESATTFLRFVGATMGREHAAMDPVRRGLLLAKVAGLVGMPLPEVQRLIEKLGGAGDSRPNQTGATGGAPPVATVQRLNLQQLKGLAAAEAWFIGALLVRPAAYEKLREEISLSLFETFRPLAEQLLDFWENTGDLESCSLADLTTMLEERGEAETAQRGEAPQTQELIRQAIELEARMSDWLDPSSLSPQSVKLMHQLNADRGMSLESLAADSLRELRAVRGGEDAAVAREFGAPIAIDPGGSPEEKELQTLRELVARRAGSTDLRNTNFPA